MSDLTKLQIRVRDIDGVREVLVCRGTEILGQIPATVVTYTLPARGPAKLTIAINADRAEIDGRRP